MVIDGVRQSITLEAAQIQHWANRRTGVGFDQLLLVEPSSSSIADFHYRIFNADGSEVAQCGNGARCLARFIWDNQLSDKAELILQTHERQLTARRCTNDLYEVSLGVPVIAPSLLLKRDTTEYEFGIVDVGNPHAILDVADVNTAPVTSLGSWLETHAHFPRGTNVEFREYVSRDTIRLRVWERGVGETSACGSGAVAAVVQGQAVGRLDEMVQVMLPGGSLWVRWSGSDTPVWLRGEAVSVFTGTISIK